MIIGNNPNLRNIVTYLSTFLWLVIWSTCWKFLIGGSCMFDTLTLLLLREKIELLRWCKTFLSTSWWFSSMFPAIVRIHPVASLRLYRFTGERIVACSTIRHWGLVLYTLRVLPRVTQVLDGACWCGDQTWLSMLDLLSFTVVDKMVFAVWNW